MEQRGSVRVRDAAGDDRQHVEVLFAAGGGGVDRVRHVAVLREERHVLLDQLPTADVDQLPVPVFFKKPQPELVEGAA